MADIVAFKNVQHKVDLKNAELSVVVEIIKGLCCLTVLPDYNELKKFNLVELGIAKEDKPKIDAVKEDMDDGDWKKKPSEKTEPTLKSSEASTEADQEPIKEEPPTEEESV